MSLRVLRKGRGFRLPPPVGHIDHWARDALYRASIIFSQQKEFLRVCNTWHRPIATEELLEASVQAYGAEDKPRILDPAYFAILKQTIDEFAPKHKIIPLTLGRVVDEPDFPRQRSPGFPWNTQGYKTKEEVLRSPEARGYIQREWDSIARGLGWKLPDVQAFHRVVASVKEKSKVRLTWGFPVDVIAEEARWFYPMWSHMKTVSKERDTCYGVGLEIGLGGIRHLDGIYSRYPNSNVMCGDFSQFDATVPGWLIRDIFDLLSDWFDFSHVVDREGKTWYVNPCKTARRWKAMVSYFLSCSIRMPSGLRYKKSKGVPSGSMFTNVIDTLANAVATRYAVYLQTGRLPVHDYYYGDDSIVFLDRLNLDTHASLLSSNFGLKLNVDKTIFSCERRNIHWLGYYNRDGEPRRELDFLLASSVYPEKKVVHPIESCARLLGQMYSTMDPQSASLFWFALHILRTRFELSVQAVQAYARSMGTKMLKFLTVLGYTPGDLTVPPIAKDLCGVTLHRVDAVIPFAPIPRFRYRERHLPPKIGAPESYANPFVRYIHFCSSFNYYGFSRDEERAWSETLSLRSLL